MYIPTGKWYAIDEFPNGGLVHENEATNDLLPENKIIDTFVAIKDDVFLFLLK